METPVNNCNIPSISIRDTHQHMQKHYLPDPADELTVVETIVIFGGIVSVACLFAGLIIIIYGNAEYLFI